MSDSRDLNQGQVARALWRVSAPMTVGIFGVLLVGLADAFFLGRYGSYALTAVGFIYPVIVSLTSLSIGLSAGTNTVVSNAIGAGNQDNKQRFTAHAILMGSGLACVVALALWWSGPWLFGVMGASGDVLDAVLDYVFWWCLSFPFLVMTMSLNAVYRAEGDSKIAAGVMVLSAVLNIALTPLLIFGWGPIPELGVAGAGMATFLARLVGFTAIITYALRTGALCAERKIATGFRTSLRKISRVAGPAALSNAINPAGMAAVTAAVAIVGDAAVGGFGAATRVQSLLLLPMLALSSGIGPVVGQAWGADRPDRAREAMRLSAFFCLGYGLLIFVTLLLAADLIAAAMTSDTEAARHTALYLRLVSFSFFGYGLLVIANAAMNARDRALYALGLSAARIGLIYLPFAWLGVYVFGYTGILGAAIVANVLGGWAAIVAVRATGLFGVKLPGVERPARLIGQPATN